MERIIERPGALDVHKESVMACVRVWDGVYHVNPAPHRRQAHVAQRGCPDSRGTLSGGPPVPSAPAGSVRGVNQVRKDGRNRHAEGTRPEGRYCRAGW